MDHIQDYVAIHSPSGSKFFKRGKFINIKQCIELLIRWNGDGNGVWVYYPIHTQLQQPIEENDYTTHS